MNSYQCRSHTIRINDANEGKIIDIPMGCGRVCGSTACQWCVARRCKKIAREIDAERNNGSGRLQWLLIDESEVNNVVASLRREMTRYRRLPLEDGVVFIFEDDHRVRQSVNPLPEGKDELGEWIEMACQTPRGSRMSGTRTRRDEMGEVIIAGWGYPPPMPEPVEGRTSVQLARPTWMLKAYSEEAGASIDAWHGMVNDDGATVYSASVETQEVCMDVFEEMGIVIHPSGPIFDIKDDGEGWSPG